MDLLDCSDGLAIFQRLKSYTREDVQHINCFTDLFRTDADWRAWAHEGLGELLEVPGEHVVMLQQTHQVKPGEAQELTFQKDEILIGREPGNDVVVPLTGVGRHHARITEHERQYFIEDLGSANGTYLNDARLQPNQPVPLEDGAQFLILPYQFVFSPRQIWRPQEPIRIASGAARVVAWNETLLIPFGGMRLFSVKVSPDAGMAVLRVPEHFLKALVDRISHAEIERIVAADSGVFEFLLLSVLERANRDLKFPFRFSLAPFEAPPAGEPGILIEFVIALTGVTGGVELFVPARLMEQIRARSDESQVPPTAVSWPVAVCGGYCDLSIEEFSGLEVDDVLLVAKAHMLLLPASRQAREHGWRAAPVHTNPRRLRIEDYFERSDLPMNDHAPVPEQSDSQKPNLAALPVRVHIVLGQVEMTLAELNRLKPGSIVELDREESEFVQLAVNGRIAGTGELVKIEGRLGVRIANWNAQ